VALLSADGSENEVVFLDAGGRPCTVDPALPMPIRGLRAEAYKTGQVVYENGFAASEWMRWMPAGHAALDNVLFAPLVLEGKVVGLMGLANKGGGFTQEDAALAGGFAEFAAIALGNSRGLRRLERSEQRFRALAETATDAIVCADAEGRMVMWNQAAEKVFGYSAEEALGSPLTMLMPERFRSAHAAAFGRVMTGKPASLVGRTIELWGLRADGSEFPLELSLAGWQYEDDVFFTGIIRDISERHGHEQALRRESGVNAMMAELARALLRPVSIEDISQMVLQYARRMTGSEFGFVGYIDPATGYAVIPTLTRDIWDQCRVPGKTVVFKEFKGLWGWVLTNRQPLLTNHPAEDPRSAGIPEGHLPIRRFLSAPAMIGQTVVGQVAVANAACDYTPPDQERIERLASVYALAVQRDRSEKELLAAKAELEERVRQRTADLASTVDRLQGEVRSRIRAERDLEAERKQLFSVLNMLPGYVAVKDRHYMVRFANEKYVDLFGPVDGRPCYRLQTGRNVACEHCPMVTVLAERRLIDWEWNGPSGRWYHAWGYPFSDADGTETMLELGIDVTERKELERLVIQADEMQQQSVGRDLHDTLGQNLTGLAFLAKGLARTIRGEQPDQSQVAEQIVALVNESISRVRLLARGLNPVGLSEDGLAGGLQDLADGVGKLFPIHCAVRCDPGVVVGDDVTAAHLYRIAQEAVNNATKHSGATNIRISLTSEEAGLRLTVEDDGRGIADGTDRKDGMGLRIMRYRAGMIGGSLSVARGSAGGTIVACAIPPRPAGPGANP